MQEYTDEEIRAYIRQWDQESAAEEVGLGRVADAYEGGVLLPVGEVDAGPMVPLGAFTVVCLVCAAVILTLLWVG